jgi:hypothetical protein
MGAVARDPDGSFRLTESAREHLVRTSPHFMGDYCALAAGSPGVLEMVERLRTNRPKGSDEGGSGVGFIYRDGLKSAMDSESMARHFTLSLAGRARNVAPGLARRRFSIERWRSMDAALETRFAELRGQARGAQQAQGPEVRGTDVDRRIVEHAIGNAQQLIGKTL